MVDRGILKEMILGARSEPISTSWNDISGFEHCSMNFRRNETDNSSSDGFHYHFPIEMAKIGHFSHR